MCKWSINWSTVPVNWSTKLEYSSELEYLLYWGILDNPLDEMKYSTQYYRYYSKNIIGWEMDEEIAVLVRRRSIVNELHRDSILSTPLPHWIASRVLHRSRVAVKTVRRKIWSGCLFVFNNSLI